MKRMRIALIGIGLLAATSGLLVVGEEAQAQGIYLGPGGISFGRGIGSYYLPLNNRGGYYAPGGYYGTRGYFAPRGYAARNYARTGLYWAPGVYWTPNNYWYGDLGWPLFNSAFPDSGRVSAGRTSAGPYYDEFEARSNLPPVPQFEELERMNWTHLRRVLAFGATQLERGLNRVATGSKWAGYLNVNRVHAIASDEANVPPTREEADELQALLKKYDQTADDDQYKAISGLWGFEAVRRSLAEFLQNPAVRYREQLVRNSTDLDRALDRFGTGATWQQYFSLPADLFVDAADVQAAKSPPDPELLRKALLKYDDVAKNPAYRMIADLPAFQTTRSSLARYLGRELPEESDVAGDNPTPKPPSDPAVSESGDIKVTPQANPFQPELNGDVTPAEPNPEAVEKSPPNSVLKPKAPAPQVEELLPPESDAPPKAAPAVREKE